MNGNQEKWAALAMSMEGGAGLIRVLLDSVPMERRSFWLFISITTACSVGLFYASWLVAGGSNAPQ